MAKFGDLIANKLGQDLRPKKQKTTKSKKPINTPEETAEQSIGEYTKKQKTTKSKKPTNLPEETSEQSIGEYTIEDYYAFQRGENIFEGSNNGRGKKEAITEDVKLKKKNKKVSDKSSSFVNALSKNLQQSGAEMVAEADECDFSPKHPQLEFDKIKNESQKLKLDVARTLRFLRTVKNWTLSKTIGIIEKELNNRFGRLQDAIDSKMFDLEERTMWAINGAQKKLENLSSGWTTFAGGGGSTYLPESPNTRDIINFTLEPTGHLDRTQSVMTFDDGTRMFSIAPANGHQYFEFVFRGKSFKRYSSDYLELSNVEGVHFIYYDSNGNLVDDPSTPDVDLSLDVVYTSIVYWSVTEQRAIYFGEERHGSTMDGVTHSYLHSTVGTAFSFGHQLQSFIIDGDGMLDAHSQFSVADGQIRDEDIIHNITNNNPQQLSTIAHIPVYYRMTTQGDWRKKDADAFPLIYSGTAGYVGVNGRPAYNSYIGGVWGLTEVTNNDYFLIHVFATNDLAYPIISICGINIYNTKPAAYSGAVNEIKSLVGLPFQEFTPIGTVICKTLTSYVNTTKTTFIRTDFGGNYIDFRKASLTPSTTSSYPTTFTGILAASSTTVIDRQPQNSFISCKYIISIFNVANNLYSSLELSVSRSGVGSVVFNVTNQLGDVINISFTALIVGLNIEVSVINNELFNLEIKFDRHIFTI